ncbi:CLK4-associating serine/arginine rich protein isoform X2 [Nymphalis io]|uniref:CLK4-associating serine/arginine rich protein isoform X2 n=1 Tax=Inachis io TaxID=171585 RepID=UPI00216A415B|nr:CLK4-associating serine/arginine rich protein isoform X2 [Nymphalis io]
MWHEARKQERMIRGMIVDYRRRAERRKDFYEKIKAEPTQFLQLHGRQCKIHLDPVVAAAGEGPAIMMPWQGDINNMIDRFDVRAHLDIIPDVKAPDVPPEELNQEERQCNYERYRILAQNAFLGISEDKFLQQLAIEEQFGVTIEEKELQREKLSEKKGTGAAIGYVYTDPGAQTSSFNGPDVKKADVKESDDDSDLEIIDVDLSIDVNKMEASQAHELNAVGPHYGMAGCDLFSFLTGDADDAEHQKQLLREEKEKAMFSGRKSRRERRAHRDKKLATRVVSPPSYAAPSAFAAASRSPSRSPSRTPSPDHATIEFITSFGPDDDDKPPLLSKPLYADKLKQNLKKPDMLYSEAVRKLKPRSRSRDRMRSQIGPRGPNSRSRSMSRSCSGSRSRSSNASGFANRNRSRSLSYESNERNTVQNKPVPRYYGRRKEDKSSSELSLDSDSSESLDDDKNKSAVGNKSNANPNQLRLTGSSSKGPSRETLTMKERLKRKMQAQLSRQLRADKRAEAERVERECRRQARRDEEMRELAIKLRRKQREMRHQRYRRSSDDDSDRSASGSSSRHSPMSERKRDNRSRSKSNPPEEKRIPVWETDKDPPPLPFRSKYSEIGESSYYSNSRRRYADNTEEFTRDDRRNDDREPNYYQNRHDRYQNSEYGRNYENHENYNRRDSYDSRFEHDRHQGPSWRRPYSQGGGSKTRHVRNSEQSYGGGPSSRHRDDESEGSSSNRSKVKLVDY